MLVLEGHTLYEKGSPVGKLVLEEGQQSERFVIVEACDSQLQEVELTSSEKEQVQTLTEGKKGKKVLLTLEGVFQRADTKNANGRIYPNSIWEKVLSPDSTQMKMVKEGDMLGEADHPKDGATLMNRVACMVTDLHRNPSNSKEILGRMVVFDTAAGRNLKAIHDGGGRLGVSSRGEGSVVRKDGVDVVQEDYNLRTWDVVYNPSTPGAYPNEVEESVGRPSSVVTEGKDHIMEPGFVKTPEDEKKWGKAKELAKKQNPDDFYALANHIFHNMKKENVSPERPGTMEEALQVLESYGVDKGEDAFEALRRVRSNYRNDYGIDGPLTEVERDAVSLYVRSCLLEDASIGSGLFKAVVRLGGAEIVVRAPSKEELRERVDEQLKGFPSFVSVEFDSSEDAHAQSARAFAPLVERKLEEAEEAKKKAVKVHVELQEMSSKLAAARDLLEQFAARTRKAEKERDELYESLQAAETLIEAMSEEFKEEGLMAGIAALAATNSSLPNIAESLSRSSTLSDAVDVIKEARRESSLFEREPLTERVVKVDLALAASQEKRTQLLEGRKLRGSDGDPSARATKNIVMEMQRRGLK